MRILLPLRIILFAVLLAQSGLAGGASAQSAPSAKILEEADIRRELQRIIAEEPTNAAEAKKALDALDKPETSPEGRQARNRRERGARRIVNGIPSRSHPAVGALLKGNDPRSAGAWCTGTLVGCDKFLTAAHCIADDPSPQSYLVFFQELGFFQVREIRWEKAQYKFPYFDLAMLTLAKPVDGIAPMPINRGGEPLNRSIATIAGFGRSGGSHFDYGIKREGSVKTAACPAELAKSKVLCWNFDADVKSSASASNTCNADSGGGVFMRDNDGPRVVEKVFGVVSGGRDKDCIKQDLSYNVDVFQYGDWIEAAGEGRLSSEKCGRPQWAAESGEPVQKSVHLDANEPDASFTVEVPDGTGALRVAMNAEDDGSGKNDFDLSVFRGDRSDLAAVCNEKGPGQFAFCKLDAPQPGSWTVLLTRKKGAGEAQVTTTLAAAESR